MRQRLESQQQENKSVQREFATLAGTDANIYKLVGPCLLKQEREEAVQSVDRRLEFIGGEIKRVEGQIADMQTESEKRKMEVWLLSSLLSLLYMFTSTWMFACGP